MNLYYGQSQYPISAYGALYPGTWTDATPCVLSVRTDMDRHLFRFYVFAVFSNDGFPYWATPDTTGMTKYYLQYQIGRARDNNWDKYCERRSIDRKGVGFAVGASSSSDTVVPQVGPPQCILVASPGDFASVDDAFDATVASVVAQLVPAAGKLVTLKVR
jgi:hypothetical protein